MGYKKKFISIFLLSLRKDTGNVTNNTIRNEINLHNLLLNFAITITKPVIDIICHCRYRNICKFQHVYRYSYFMFFFLNVIKQ